MIEGTWIGQTPAGPVIARPADGHLAVDRPAAGQFRQAYPWQLDDGAPVVDGVTLTRMADIPASITAACGWYGSKRDILLAQVAEPYFGEPMALFGTGDRVQRAYPVGPDRLLADDGTEIMLQDNALLLPSGPVLRALREHQVTFAAELAGTIVWPDGPGPHPAAVFVHGAAGGQRDACRLFVAPLIAAGVAVLIYDKPGHGMSGGPADPSIYDQADAASAAMDCLLTLPQIDASRVGLSGFSNGMWAVPIIAAKRDDVAFIAGAGAPGVSMAASEVHRRTKTLCDAGVSEATAAAAGRAWANLFAIVAAGQSTPETLSGLDEALTALGEASDLDRYEVPAFARDNPMLSPIPPLMPSQDLAAMAGSQHDPQLGHDPAEDYRNIRCPVFLRYGSEDTSVPVSASVSRIEQACREAGTPFHAKVYPGLEHMLNALPEGLTGLSNEDLMYQFHGFSFGPETSADLTAWLRQLWKQES